MLFPVLNFNTSNSTTSQTTGLFPNTQSHSYVRIYVEQLFVLNKTVASELFFYIVCIRNHNPQIMSGKKTKQNKVPPLTKCIRDELIMCCALKAYSRIKCGGGKNQKTQWFEMERFYHGSPPNHPGLISLLSLASYSYRHLYDTYTKVSTNKSDKKTSIVKHKLKRIFVEGCHFVSTIVV